MKKDGVWGQGKNNPQFLFSDHALVKHSTGIYDPSYGAGPEVNLKSWIDKDIEGLGDMPPVEFSFNGDRQYIASKCSPGFIKHTITTGETLAGISVKYGIASALTLYNHKYNSSFKVAHPAPVVVKSGDIIFIPREISGKAEILKIV
ncbi:hypothetical protein MNBD_GAMMA11-2270 [hydrothermal vent metagenome]|uniref:LysM domain-containing protein n=1 Tax=hydrothermal vent metagenome TaxID=652676 RepID=A0A3B0X847_9ZZZZ